MAQICDGGLAPIVQPSIDAVPRTARTPQVLGVLFVVAAENVGEQCVYRLLVKHDPSLQIELRQLLLGFLKLWRVKDVFHTSLDQMFAGRRVEEGDLASRRSGK